MPGRAATGMPPAISWNVRAWLRRFRTLGPSRRMTPLSTGCAGSTQERRPFGASLPCRGVLGVAAVSIARRCRVLASTRSRRVKKPVPYAGSGIVAPELVGQRACTSSTAPLPRVGAEGRIVHVGSWFWRGGSGTLPRGKPNETGIGSSVPLGAKPLIFRPSAGPPLGTNLDILL